MDLGYISRIRWFMLAFGVAALMLTVMSAPASASAPDKKIETFMELMHDSGHVFGTAVEAQDALTESGIPVDVAIELLEKMGIAAADLFVPLVVEILELTDLPGAILPIKDPATAELWGTIASTRCGRNETRLNYASGIDGRLLMWMRLSTASCYNGSRIVGTPTAIVTSGVSARGLFFGYRWTSTPSVEDAYWVQHERVHRIVARGTYQVCPAQNLWICFGGSSPWISHDNTAWGIMSFRTGLR